MFPSFCGAMGLAGWLITLLVWVALIATVVWGITRLFPDRNEATAQVQARRRPGEDAAPPLIKSNRR
ncbi:hypothetical protein [Actinophytocola sp.]|uniref:hypothetical protein n=1 Tax=Actinophytocola sp. TaxID=1872138 RepID=UPI002D7EDFAA|nr:hypothetical protein [Actinophytocola sp.]HET9139696.1 hypothetical protein [Actinophytocola sp.]